MRILMYSGYFPPQYSGAANQAIGLAKKLRDRGHHVEFATIRWPGLNASDLHQGFTVHRLELGRGKKHREFRLWFQLLLFAWARRKDFDIIHSHGAYYTNSIAAPIAKLLGWKSLFKASLEANDLAGIGISLTGRIHYFFLGLADAYIAISEELRQEFADAGLPRERIRLLPNGVDTERFRPAEFGEKEALRKKLGLPKNRPIVLAVGVFDLRKNIGWLMQHWIEQKAFGTPGILVAIGPQSRDDPDGGFYGHLAGLARGNPDLLRMVPQVENIEEYYRAADCFVLPSRSEGLPNVILEAMASGLPCIGTDVGGTRELIQDGLTGFLFAVDDLESLARGIRGILENQQADFAIRARNEIEKRFSLDVRAEEYEALYLQISRNRCIPRKRESLAP